MGSQPSGAGAGLPPRGAPFTMDQFQIRQPYSGATGGSVSMTQVQGESQRTRCQPAVRRLNAHEQQQIRQRLAASWERIKSLLEARNHNQASAATQSPLDILTSEDWDSLGSSRYSYQEHIRTMPDWQMDEDELVQRVYLQISERMEAITASGEIADENERELAREYNRLYELLMQWLQSLAAQFQVVQLTPGWNPQTIGATTLRELVRHLLGDYEYQGSRGAGVCQGRTLEQFKALSSTHSTGSNLAPTSGHITDANSLGCLSGTLVTHQHMHLIAFVDLHIANSEEEEDTLIVMSDGQSYWFGSHHLGGFFSTSLSSTVSFLKALILLLKEIFGVEYYTILSRIM